MYKLNAFIWLIFLILPTCSQAEEASAPGEIPSFELDKSGKRSALDFNVALSPVSNTELLLSHFANRPLLIFYFSAKCMHCQNAFPHIQKLAQRMDPLGVATIGIAIKNNSENDIRNFIRQFKCDFPVFQDEQRAFSDLYGTGHIPLLIAVNPGGNLIRFKSFKEDKTPDVIYDLFASGKINQ